MDDNDLNTVAAGLISTETAAPVAQAVATVATVAAVLPQVIADPIGAAVAGLETWWADHILDSPFSRDTDLHNRLHALKIAMLTTIENVKG